MNTPKEAAHIVGSLQTDCLHYRGDRPCKPHTTLGVVCKCDQYIGVIRQGVIIKLGAAGDVLRTTPLLRTLAAQEGHPRVLFVTHHPELIPAEAAEAVKPDAMLMERLRSRQWDFCWNLDKDLDACLIAGAVVAPEKKGYGIRNGVPFPLDEAAWHKFATGVNDAYSKANRLSYVQEIFDIVGLPFRGEEYWLKPPSGADVERAAALFAGDDWIGLNTGAGFRWPTRLWPEVSWKELIGLLQGAGMRPLLLGGPEERERNERLAGETGAESCGVVSLGVFYALIHQCRCVVSSVTQAMHLAIGARRPLLLLNNIFNGHEFELYGRGVILEPTQSCDCYYAPICRTGRNCISEITPQDVFREVLEINSGNAPETAV
jgi:heptosyltransferase-2